MTEFISQIVSLATAAGSKIVLALLVYLIGSAVIRKLMKLVNKTGMMSKLDPTVASFASNFMRAGLYCLLVVSVIGILGVPMASIVAALASAGLAVGMAMQGALSNLAGGIMLLVFRPFSVGDYISTGSGEGTVSDITMVYTVLKTVDNRTITIPNGALMNAAITNVSRENTRRVDLTFSCAKGEDVVMIQNLLSSVVAKNEKVFSDPAPFVRLSGGTNESMEFTVRAWVNSADYWDVHFDLIQAITEEFGKAGVKAPAARIITETK